MNPRLSDRDLRAYAAGALDPGERLGVDDALHGDASARRRLAAMQAAAAGPTPDGRWRGLRRDWPGGIPARAMETERAVHLGDGGLPANRVGDRVTLRVPTDAGHLRPVVIREEDGHSEVLHPQGADDWIALSAWPRGPRGYEIDVYLQGEPGIHRYVVVLAAPDVEVDWAVPPSARWAELRRRVEEGRDPVFHASLRVE